MIKDLTYSVTFPTNGIGLKGRFTPPPGITAVTGDNGAGKTFGTSELPRYMLFGKKALRGPAGDYKTLDATMDFEIAGESFRVERNRKAERLLGADGEVLAVGADAVDKRIRQELGFSLDVFDIACAAVQKQTDRLSQLRPAERKRLIDEVVGLTSNEAVEKACREEAKMLRREAEATRDLLVPSEKPDVPEHYRPTADLASDLAAARNKLKAAIEFQRVIDAVGPAPEMPPFFNGGRIDLEGHEQRRFASEAEFAQLVKRHGAMPEASHTVEEIEIAEEILFYNSAIKLRGPKPTISMPEAEAGIQAWAHYGVMKSTPDVETKCPKCDHEFRTAYAVPDRPLLSLEFFRAELRANENWQLPLEEPRAGSVMSSAEISTARRALEQADEKEKLGKEISGFKHLADLSADLQAQRERQAAWKAYEVLKAAHDRRLEDAATATAELQILGHLPSESEVSSLDSLFIAAKIYEAKQEAYVVAKARFDELTVTIAEKLRRAEAYKKGADALSSARSSVKAYLAPSLSRVASSLIQQMTGGVLNTVLVDEDMNITVDGQDIATLSGAGSTVANLALRIGLGQVLVHKRFPVFIADEADADMRDTRAQFTLECLSNLRKQIQQIIVISHKEISIAVDLHHDLDNSLVTS